MAFRSKLPPSLAASLTEPHQVRGGIPRSAVTASGKQVHDGRPPRLASTDEVSGFDHAQAHGRALLPALRAGGPTQDTKSHAFLEGSLLHYAQRRGAVPPSGDGRYDLNHFPNYSTGRGGTDGQAILG